MPRRLTPERREQIASDAAERYRAGESWEQIGERHGITGAHARRLTVARHNITYRRWGQRPSADPQQVCRLREEGRTLDQIAEHLSVSRQAVRTALEAAGKTSPTRYPRLSQRRAPTPEELERIDTLYRACPEAPRSRPGFRDTRGAEGRAVAEACRDLIDDGVPMQTLSRALGRGSTWAHWILAIHDLRPSPRLAATTSRRTRDL